ncbi:MAG: LamG-like jellyroll fold domain-containing protein, partial [Flavobacteriales bacterium]
MMVRAIGSCSEPCLTENPAGCTNPDACNFNSLALVDDGTCLVVGSSCDDGNVCTIEDVINSDCVCRGFGVCQPNILEPSFNCNDGFFQLSLNIQVDPQSVQNTLIVESSNGGYSILPPTLSTYNYVYLGQYPADGQPITIYAYFAEGGGIDTLFTQAPGCCIGYNYDFAFESIYPIVPAPIEYNVCIENTAPTLVFDVATNLSLTYQWYLVAPNGGTAMIQGATASTFSPQTNEVSTISYFCIGTYYEGCSVTSSTYIVNVIDGSDFIGSSQDLTICPGYNAVLFPHLSVRGGNVIWENIPAFSFNNGYSLTVTPIQTTEYPFTYTLGDCINYSDTITVEVLPLPSIQVTPSSSCSADPVTLTATVSEPGGSFLWSTGETTSSIVVSANQTTTYTVEYTAPGCTPTENTCYDPELADFCAEQNPWIACPTCFADFLPYAFEICTCDNQTAIVESCNGYIIYRNGNCESQNEISVSASATIYPQALSSCNDGDPCTVNDIIQSDCTCSGTLLDENQNGVCDLEENCNITAIPNPICEGDTSTLSLGINNYENRVAQFTNSLQQRVIIPYTYSATSVIDNFAYELWVNTSRSITLLPEKTGGINVQAVNGQNFAVFPSYYLNPNLRGTGISVGTNGLSIVEHSGNFFASRFTYATSLIGWHHIAVSYINNGFNVYLDGQFIGYRPNGTNFFNNHNRVAPLMALGIGYPGSDPMANSNYDPNDNYSGLMDNFRLWNRTLTGTEINLLFDKGLESSDFDGNYVNITFDEGNCDNQTTVNPPVVIELDNGPSSYPFLSTPVFQYIEGNSFNDFTVNQYQSPYDILWSTGENSTSISVAPSVTTTYSVTVNQNGQICTDDIIIEVIPAETYYLDADGDNFGNPDVPLLSCEGAPNGYVSDNTDCNDDDAFIHPGAPCDDFNLTTYNDIYDSNCLCGGTAAIGCTDPLATNYNPNALIDDGSCIYGACSNLQINVEQGICKYNNGQVLPSAEIYHSFTGSCVVDSLYITYNNADTTY